MKANNSMIQDLYSCLMIMVCLLPPVASAIDVTIETDNEEWEVSDTLMSFHITYDSMKDFVLDEDSTLVGKSVNLAGWAEQTGVKSARFPGGTVIKNWDWETGGDADEDPWDPNYDPRSTNPANEWSFDQYLEFVADAGMVPHIGINNLSGVKYKARFEDSLNRAAAQVQAAVDAGYTGAVYYIGNEEDHIQGGEYAAMHIDKLHAQAMKAVDPTCKIIWNVQGGGYGHMRRMLNMNDGWLDGVESHTKWPWGGTSSRNPVDFTTWQTTTPMKDHQTGRVHRSFGNSLRNAGIDSGYPNIFVANNEYGSGKGTQMTGFGNDYKWHMVMTEQIVELFIGNYDMSAYWNLTAMLQLSNPNPRMKAIHLAWEMLGDAQGATMLNTTDDGVHTPAFAVKTDDDIQLFLLNKSSSSQTVNVDFTGAFLVKTSGAHSAKSMIDNASHWGTTTNLNVTYSSGIFSTTLPGLSFTQMTFPLTDRTETNAPAVPTGLTATYLNGNGNMRLNWADNTEGDLHDYRVYRSRYDDRDFKVFKMDVSNSAVTDTTVITGVDYYYKVAAVDTNRNVSAASAAVRGRMPRYERVVAADFEVADKENNTDSGNLNRGTTTGGSWSRVPNSGADVRQNKPVYANYYHPVNQALRIDEVGDAFSPTLTFDSPISRDGVEIGFDATTIRAGNESKNIKVRVMNNSTTLCTIVLSVGLSGKNHRLCYLNNSDNLTAFPNGSQGDLNDAGTAYDPPLDTIRIFLTDTGFSAALLDKKWVSAEVPYTGTGANITKIRFGGAAPAGFFLDNIRVSRILPPDDGSNTAPAFTSDPFTVSATAKNAKYYETSITSYASDVDGDALTFRRVSGPSWLRIREDGTIYGTPPALANGTDSFQVKVEDPYGDFDIAEMKVVIFNTNLEPVFHDDPIVKGSGFSGIPYTGSLAGDASDGDGDPMTFSKISGSAWLSVAADGTLSGTPGGAQTLHVFTVGVSDGSAPNTATLHINVLPNNSPPAGVLIGIETFEDPASNATWAATTNTTDISGSITPGAGAGGYWRDAAFPNAGSTDLTFGSTYSGAAANTGALSDGVRSQGDTTYLDVLITNDGTDDLDIDSFNFDAWRVTSSAADDWSLEVLPRSSITTGAVSGATMAIKGAQPSDSDFDDFDVALTGLADNTLAANESATFRLTLNNASATGALHIDNVAVAGQWVNIGPVWGSNPIVKADATSGVLYDESLADNASDQNLGDTLTFIKLSGPSWLSVGTDGSLSGIPTDDDVGVSSAQVEVSDGRGETVVATIEIPVLEIGPFASWSMLYGLIDPMHDQDGDGLLPLMEYALGGDPTNGADVAILPSGEVAQNGSITYTYRRRQDAAARGLTYTVKRATNLVDWSTNGCVEVGSDPSDVEFESVTVWVDSGDTVFVRLEIFLDE